jgi:hypothetical protein
LQKQLDGWIASSAKYYYWKAKRTHPLHHAYTNARTDHAVEFAAILLTGFGLQADGKFPNKLSPLSKNCRHLMAPTFKTPPTSWILMLTVLRLLNRLNSERRDAAQNRSK